MSKLFDQYYKDYHLNLKMASAQVVKASVMNNPCQDPNHPDDLFQARFLNNVVSHAILNITTFEHKCKKKKKKNNQNVREDIFAQSPSINDNYCVVL